MLQLQATLSKNVIEKRRTLKTTCCEFFSHFIIIVLLIYGYNLSDVSPYSAEYHSTIRIVVPPRSESDFFDIIDGPLPTIDLDTFVSISRLISPTGGDADLGELAGLSFISQYDNLLYLGTLHFAPDNAETRSLIDYLNETYLTFSTLKHRVHTSERKAIRYILNNLEERALGLIVLRDIGLDRISYKLRLNYTTLPNTNSIVNDVPLGLDITYQRYIFSGFLSLKNAVDNWVYNYTGIRELAIGNSSSSCEKPSFFYLPFPTPAFEQNIFYPSVGFLLGLALTMSTLYPVSRMVKAAVEEKEMKMKELMEIMGLFPWVNNLAWSITAFVLFFWIAISATFLTTISFLPKSNKALVFAYFFFFCMSEIPFCFLISVFFNKAKIAAIVGPVALFVSLLPRFIFISTNSYEEATNKFLASLLSPSAFAFGADILSAYEYSGEGVQLYNMNEGTYSFNDCLRLMIADIIIYALLAWYLAQILPSEYGTQKHPLFIFDCRYWQSEMGLFSWLCGKELGDGTAVLTGQELVDVKELSSNSGSRNIEVLDSEATDNKVKVLVSGLRKRYADGKLALKKLSFAMLEDQITCLLGHNGAGKSTAISILTGMSPPTAGDCIIWGHRLTSELPSIRQVTGVCPQQNVLFATLTVKEHLLFFGKIKGYFGSKLHKAVNELIEEVGLSEKSNVLSSALSGGMKRKLCLAMALVGNPKFVLLDEPTSGMDPYSRRATWELLQRNKSGRTILLTTHFMDEADILGDRIVIMSEGRLKCSGTSLFLKNTYGAGYVLTLAKADAKSSPEPVIALVQGVIPDATLNSAIAGEIEFKLPLTSSFKFASLFATLKDRVDEIGVSGYGVSITTLEKVFVTLAEISLNAEEDNVDDQDHINQVYFFRVVASFLSTAFKLLINCVTYSCINYRIFPRPSIFLAERPNISSEPNGTQSSEQGVEMKSVAGESPPAVEVEHKYESLQLQPVEHSDSIHQEYDLSNDHGEDKILSFDVEKCGGVVMVNSKVAHDDIDEGDTARQYIQGDVITQMKELLSKRVTIQSRDANGFFFQIVFPALQILLILAILTIDINPAGRTLELDAGAYRRVEKRATTLYTPGNFETADSVNSALASLFNGDAVSDGPINVYMPDILSEDRQYLKNISFADNSTALSEYLLKSNELSEGYRMGAYAFNDLIPLNLTVDWTWVKENSDSILQNAGSLYLLLDEFGLNSFNVSINALQQLELNGTDLSQLQASLRTGVFNYSLFSSIFLDALENNPALDALNISIGGDFTANLILSFLRPFDGQAINTTTFNISALVDDLFRRQVETATISFEGLSYNSTSEILTFVNVVISFNGVNPFDTIQLGDVSVTKDEILSLLPDGIIVYDFAIPSAVTIMHNSSSSHAIGIFDGEIVQSQFAKCVPPSYSSTSSSKFSYFKYSAKNHPLPLTAQQSLEIRVILSIFASLLILIPLCYLPASFITFIVRERVSKSKHLQLVSSVSPYLYWMATYVYDMALFVVLIGCVFGVLFAYGAEASKVFTGTDEAMLALFLLLLSYGGSVISLCYIYSFVFENHATAQISIMVFNFLTGFVAVLAYFIMVNIPSTKALGETLVHVFRFFPPYNVGEGLINISANYYYNSILGRNVGYLSWEVAGRDIVFMFAEAVGYLMIVLTTESESFQRIVNQIDRYRTNRVLLELESSKKADGSEIDNDVLAEADISRSCNPTDAALLLVGIDKLYMPSIFGSDAKHAVRDFNLRCLDGERFGLLGINGAGKSTTLNILTGDIQPTRGRAYIDGRPLSDPKTRSLVGYCPQTDPLLDLMTGYETLWFFGRIRGMPEEFLTRRVENLIKGVGLSAHAHKPCGTYSGGNKRKLSLAVALIGDPKVLFLDEPSTGMDPIARRHMWEVIAAVSENKSVILTTHYMEECEALCTRLGIMVSGRLQCIGSCQHLKNKYGVSYELEIRREVGTTTSEIFEIIKQHLLSAEIEEEHGSFFRMKAGNEIDLSAAFSILESLKTENKILSYSVSQSTLEQIFIKFAALQEEGKKDTTTV